MSAPLPHGWREVATDPPPIGLQVLGLCSYIGARGVTALRDDIFPRRWDNWYINHPTHWQHLPPALPLTPEPPVMDWIVEPN